MVNFDSVIMKIGALKGITSSKDIAATLGISAQDYSNRKKRGTLLPLIVEWAINENVNLDWLLKDESPGTVQTEACKVAEEHDPYIVKVAEMMRNMDDDTKKDIQLSVEKEKLLRELIKERQDKEAA